MKVTILSSLPPQRGVTPYTLHLLDALHARDDVEICALGFSSLYPRFAYPGGSPNDPAGRRDVRVPVRRVLSWYNPFSWVWAGLTVRGDIVHAQWWSWFVAAPYAVVLALAALRGKRIVVTAHNVRPHEGSRWKRWLNDFVIRRAHRLIVHGERNRAVLIGAGVAPERVFVVPHGVIAVPVAAPVGREEARRVLGLAADARVALLFGNLRPYKGADVLMEAARIARVSLPDLRVVIAGEIWRDCPNPRDQASVAGVADIVTVRPGFVPDGEIAALFAASDVVVLPYRHFDGQSGAATLALSAGRALVVSDAGGLPNLVRDERAVVQAGDTQALARALVAVLADDAFRTKLEADSRRVRASLSWERIAEATVAVYAGLLQTRRRTDAEEAEAA